MKNIKSDLKIIVVGNSNAGKTSFVNKWTKNQFQEAYKATIVSEFGYKIFEHNSKVYRIQVWDLAGQDKSATMTKVFCKDSHGVIVLSDILDPSSLEATIKWKRSIDDSVTFFDGTPLPMMLIQNKIDLDEAYKDKEAELKNFAAKNGFFLNYQVSVKQGINIVESMNEFLASIIDKTEGMTIKKEAFSGNQVPNESIIITNDNIKRNSNKSKDGCCS